MLHEKNHTYRIYSYWVFRNPRFDHEAGILSLIDNYDLQRWCEDVFCEGKQQRFSFGELF